jgi:hypothetical protein
MQHFWPLLCTRFLSYWLAYKQCSYDQNNQEKIEEGCNNGISKIHQTIDSMEFNRHTACRLYAGGTVCLGTGSQLWCGAVGRTGCPMERTTGRDVL